MKPKRGDVWLVRLDPFEGSEQAKTRPCLVVSPADFTPYALFVITPLTGSAGSAPYRPRVTFRGKQGFVLPEQVRTVARSRLMRHMGAVDRSVVNATLVVLREMFED